jgi:tricorn protease
MALFVLVLISSSLVQSKECRLMRYPDIHKDKIVFTYGGDLWLVASEGGVARKLTSHPGEEVFPKLSPDGEYIAFTGEYEGSTHIYVMPAEGGEPRQITFHPDIFDVPERVGYNDQIIDWYPDGRKLLFRSRMESHQASGSKLFSVDADGGFPEVLQLPESGLACLSPDASKLAYNRAFTESRTWKRYKGGMAQDVWIYDLKNNKIEQITDWEGTDSSPMWFEDKIYFNSDRDHTLNIFSYDLNTKKTKKITNHSDYDVKWPSLGPGAIVYENGGYLYVLNLDTGDTRKISVEVPGDLILTRPSYEKVSDLIHSASLSPAGKRAVFSARGDIFTVPAEKGNARNITQTQGVREANPVWSPDGKWIAYLSDKTGEYEIYIRPQDGTGEEQRITRDGDCYRFDPKWSADSKKILYTDKKMRLFYVDIEKKEPVLVDKGDYTQIWVANWSPDSKWITYTKNESHFYEAIYVYNLADKKAYKITDNLNDDVNPVFDPGGQYLYFISSRSFAPTFSDFEQEYIYANTRNIYLMTLQADSLSPFAPVSDEEELKEEKKEEEEDKDKEKEEEEAKEEEGKEDKDKKEDKKKDEDKDIKIDLANIDQRIVGIPIPSGNYGNLNAAKGKIFYMSYPAERREGGPEGPQGTLYMYDIKEKKQQTVLAGINGYGLSSDGKKILYAAGPTYGIIDAKESKVGDGSLNLSELEMKVDPKAEWAQIFNEAWRIERDFFYDPNMHGVDWDLMKKRYGELLPYVAHRSDLTYIIGELIGELCTSHTYVGGGKMPSIDRYGVGLLGCDFEVDPDADYYRFKKIYKGENWKDDRRAPLTEPGVVVNQGDYLIAVNGKEIRTSDQDQGKCQAHF